jgi:hypothetical protein
MCACCQRKTLIGDPVRDQKRPLRSNDRGIALTKSIFTPSFIRASGSKRNSIAPFNFDRGRPSLRRIELENVWLSIRSPSDQPANGEEEHWHQEPSAGITNHDTLQKMTARED